jgi:hypothetical protein
VIFLSAPIFADHAGFGYTVEPTGISKILTKSSMKIFLASILPELAMGNAIEADAFFL